MTFPLLIVFISSLPPHQTDSLPYRTTFPTRLLSHPSRMTSSLCVVSDSRLFHLQTAVSSPYMMSCCCCWVALSSVTREKITSSRSNNWISTCRLESWITSNRLGFRHPQGGGGGGFTNCT